jgi:hypothetical protein
MPSKKTSSTSAIPIDPNDKLESTPLPIPPLPIPFSRCKFVTNEISHDLRSALSDTIGPLIYKHPNNLAVFLDNPGCSTYPFRGLGEELEQVIHDYKILPKILKTHPTPNYGYTKDYFIVSEDLLNVPVYVVTMIEPPPPPPPFSNINSSGLTPATMCKIKMNNNKTLKDTVWNIFNPNTLPGVPGVHNKLNNENIFFIIDIGDNLIPSLTKTETPHTLKPDNIHLHVITSVANIADSSSVKPPDAKVYETEQYVDYANQVKIHSWWYGPDLNINNDHYFMSKYNINTHAYGPSWEAEQTWRDPALPVGSVYHTLNAHIDNSKPKAIQSINKLAKHFNPHKTTNTSTNSFLFVENATPEMIVKKQDLNLAFQKKRSGDYFQIISAKNFPTKATNDAGNFREKRRNAIHHGSGNITPETGPLSNTFLPGITEEYCRRRTYFVTGDWPAFCYAIYLKINCIMVNNSSKYVISINFP